MLGITLNGCNTYIGSNIRPVPETLRNGLSNPDAYTHTDIDQDNNNINPIDNTTRNISGKRGRYTPLIKNVNNNLEMNKNQNNAKLRLSCFIGFVSTTSAFCKTYFNSKCCTGSDYCLLVPFSISSVFFLVSTYNTDIFCKAAYGLDKVVKGFHRIGEHFKGVQQTDSVDLENTSGIEANTSLPDENSFSIADTSLAQLI